MRLALPFLLFAGPALAQLAPGPAAERTYVDTTPFGSHLAATGAFIDTLPSETIEGAVIREVWQVPASDATTLQLLDPLRDQLVAEGWDVVFDCHTRACGGFDFRFEIDVTPAPDMFVDLADYRYLSARKGGAWTTLVVSLSGDLGYIQVTTVDPESSVDPVVKSASNATPRRIRAGEPSMVATLESLGRAVLDDLEFATGSTELAGRGFTSLEELAAFLNANPGTTIALVGHTDAEGGAEGNMAISRSRANSARDVLIDSYGIASDRIDTHGVGFFAPVAPNDTAAGREANRRVEVVITSTE
ncbi:MAG: OmpA family protein [Pseudomonadota bacterium]